MLMSSKDGAAVGEDEKVLGMDLGGGHNICVLNPAGLHASKWLKW